MSSSRNSGVSGVSGRSGIENIQNSIDRHCVGVTSRNAEVSGHSVIENIQDIIDRYCLDVSKPCVLEAGCGSSSHFRFPETATLCGIDISEEQLSKNKILTEKIHEDLQTYSTTKRYDMVICWNVLEHLRNPEKALDNLLTWTKDDGIIIISVPNVLSVKGLITKFTPLWFHRLVYKYVFRYTKNKPFYAYMKLSMTPKSILKKCNDHIIEYHNYQKTLLRKPYKYFYEFTIVLLKKLSFGKIHGDLSQFTVVIRKNIIEDCTTN